MTILKRLLIASIAAITLYNSHALTMKRTHTNEIFESIDNQEEDFGQQVARLGRCAIPKEVFIKNIMPRMILELVTQKLNISPENNISPETIARAFSDQKGKNFGISQPMLFMSFFMLLEGWNLLEQIIQDHNWKLNQETIETILNLLDEKTKMWINENYTMFEQPIDEINNKQSAILSFMRSALSFLDEKTKRQVSQICNDVINELRILWPHIETQVKEGFIEPLKALDFNQAATNSLKEVLNVLLFYDKNIPEQDSITCKLFNEQYNSLSKEIKKIHVIMEEGKDLLGKDRYDQIYLMLEDAVNQITKAFSLLDENILSELKTLNGRMIKENFDASLATEYLPKQLQDPTIQMLFLANTNNTDLMEWLSSYDSNYINAIEPITNHCPLYAACRASNQEATRFILDRGVDLDGVITDKGDTLLHVACQNCDIHLVQFLLENGANPNILNQKNKSPLMSLFDGRLSNPYAIDTDLVYHIVQLLIQYGAKVNVSNDRGPTPFINACFLVQFNSELIKVVCLLLDNLAVIDAQDTKGFTALMQACHDGSLELVTLLINRSANIHAVNKMNITALHMACHHNHPDIVHELLKAGANSDAKTADGKTPYDLIPSIDQLMIEDMKQYISWKNSTDFIKSLLKYGVQECL